MPIHGNIGNKSNQHVAGAHVRANLGIGGAHWGAEDARTSLLTSEQVVVAAPVVGDVAARAAEVVVEFPAVTYEDVPALAEAVAGN